MQLARCTRTAEGLPAGYKIFSFHIPYAVAMETIHSSKLKSTLS